MQIIVSQGGAGGGGGESLLAIWFVLFQPCNSVKWA